MSKIKPNQTNKNKDEGAIRAHFKLYNRDRAIKLACYLHKSRHVEK